MKQMKRWPAVVVAALAVVWCVSGCSNEPTGPKAGDPQIPQVTPGAGGAGGSGTKAGAAGKGGAAALPPINSKQ